MTTALVSLTTQLANRLDIEAGGAELVTILKATAFKGPATDAQMTALMVVVPVERKAVSLVHASPRTLELTLPLGESCLELSRDSSVQSYPSDVLIAVTSYPCRRMHTARFVPAPSTTEVRHDGIDILGSHF